MERCNPSDLVYDPSIIEAGKLKRVPWHEQNESRGLQVTYRGEGYDRRDALGVAAKNPTGMRAQLIIPAGAVLRPESQRGQQNLVVRDRIDQWVDAGETVQLPVYAYCGNEELGAPHDTFLSTPYIFNTDLSSQLAVWRVTNDYAAGRAPATARPARAPERQTFSAQQVFDVQFYYSGSDLHVSRLCNPHNLRASVGAGDYYAFFDSGAPGKYGLALYSSSGAMKQELHTLGHFRSLSSQHVHYESGGITTIVTTGTLSHGSSTVFRGVVEAPSAEQVRQWFRGAFTEKTMMDKMTGGAIKSAGSLCSVQ